MRKTAKGALAAGAAATLLMGGGSTLAFWNDDALVNGGAITAGYLTIDPLVVAPSTTACDPTWKYSSAGSTNGTTVVNFVPGDRVTKSCTFVIAAQGDNLTATPTLPTTLAIPATPATGQPAVTTFNATVAATYAITGRGAITATGPITPADDGRTMTATITVTIPFGNATTINANDTQRITATLNTLTVALTQTTTANNPNP